jgi:hypothetical protein
MGLTDGLVRISIGLDATIEEPGRKMLQCIDEIEKAFNKPESVVEDNSLYAADLS